MAAFNRMRAAVGLVAGALLLGACSERLGIGGSTDGDASLSPEITGSASVPPPPGGALAAAVPLPPDMAGRWLLAAGDGRRCRMNFGALGSAGEGSIAPERGCPDNLTGSRRWLFDQGSLVIRDQTGTPLVQLAATATHRFEGTTDDGQRITLTR